MIDAAMPEIERIRDAASSSRLRASLVDLPAPRSRLHHAEAMTEAGRLLLARWQDAGWETAEYPFHLDEADGVQDFDDFPAASYTDLHGCNLVAVRRGQVNEAIVVGAHLDTVRDSPGACDNGAAIAALMEIARLLATVKLRRTVILAAFDMEEIGILGSPQLVRQLSEDYEIGDSIVLESVGFVNPAPRSQRIPFGFGLLFPRQTARIRARRRRADWTAAIHRSSAAAVVETLERELTELAGPHALVSLRDPLDRPVSGRLLRALVPSLRNLARSDHVAFWDADIPAVLLTDTANFRSHTYHQETDTVDTIDFDHLRRITAAVSATVVRLAGRAEP